MMYFFSGSDVCLKLMPACAVMSVNCGMGRPLHFFVFAPGGGGGGSGCPLGACPRVLSGTQNRTVSKSQHDHNMISFLPITTSIVGGRFRMEVPIVDWSLQQAAHMLKLFSAAVYIQISFRSKRPELVNFAR